MNWQARASQLVALIDPEHSFARGEFEKLDEAGWAALVTELRGKALTEEKLWEIRLHEGFEIAKREAALAKLTASERKALGV